MRKFPWLSHPLATAFAVVIPVVVPTAAPARSATVVIARGGHPAHPRGIERHRSRRMRWGVVGHAVVADIAQTRLSPEAAATANRLLHGDRLRDVASWADEARGELGPSYSPWHYVDIEIIDSSYAPTRDCPRDQCIVAALEHQITVLGDTNRSDSVRAVALKWVIHLVGDLQQPLHAGERGDRGGNDVKVRLAGRLTNLHAAWDSGILNALGLSEADLVDSITRELAHRHDLDSIAAGSVVDWAMESHDISRDVVYANLPSSLVLTDQYVAAAGPVIRERLLRGGVRLAGILNRVLGH